MSDAFILRCIGCGASASPAGNCRCPHCGELLEALYPGLRIESPGEWQARWRARRDSDRPEDASGVWRFRELLPILDRAENAVTLREGNTPLYELPRCARMAGLERLWAKHQGMNPSGSFKDTGMTAAISRAKQEGYAWVACASTGNTSASMAAYAARAGLRALVLVPEGKITASKLAQALDYGARTIQLRTDFDGCVRVLAELVGKLPLYLVNSVNPFRLEGQKTAAFEIAESCGWQAPDHVIVPGGNLANASALGKGFRELRQLGLIARQPRLSIVQAAGANPLVRSWREHGGERLEPVAAETAASAIRIGNPASWKKAVVVLRETGGACLDVSEEEIASAKAAIGAEGIGCEPASAAALAGAIRLAGAGFIGCDERVVLVLTGHMLKDPEYVMARAAHPPVVEAAPEAVLREMERA